MFRTTTFLALLMSSVWSMPAGAQNVSLDLDWGPQRWEGYPENVDKPVSEWVGKILHVHVVKNWVSTLIINTEGSSAQIRGNVLRLCYHQQYVSLKPGQIIPGALAPVILNFTVSGIPIQSYAIEVPDECR
jgi:hypothetical protein